MKQNIVNFHSHYNDKYWWFIARKIAIKNVLRKIKFKGEILDIGCGAGGNLKMLSEFGDVTGIEKDQELIKNAKSIGFRVLEGHLPNNIPSLNNKLSLITIFDVLEHIEDDNESIKTIFSILEKDGHLLLTVPAFKFLWSKHDEDNMHFRRYTLPKILDLLSANGFKIVYSSYLFFLLSPAVFFIRKILKREKISPINPYLNKLLILICAIEAFFLNFTRLPFGTSIIVLAKKNR